MRFVYFPNEIIRITMPKEQSFAEKSSPKIKKNKLSNFSNKFEFQFA